MLLFVYRQLCSAAGGFKKTELSTSMRFQTLREAEGLPKGIGGSRGIQLSKSGGIVLLCSNGQDDYIDDLPKGQLNSYIGEGRKGQQVVTSRGNRLLADTISSRQRLCTVYIRIKQNNWTSVGEFAVTSLTRKLQNERSVLVFKMLKIVTAPRSIRSKRPRRIVTSRNRKGRVRSFVNNRN